MSMDPNHTKDPNHRCWECDEPPMAEGPTGTRWPNHLSCERTLDIHLYRHGRRIRIWFDARSTWTPDAMQDLARGMREKCAQWTDTPSEVVLDWMTTLEGVNAVQVIDRHNGCDIGVMVYTVPFDDVPQSQTNFTIDSTLLPDMLVRAIRAELEKERGSVRV